MGIIKTASHSPLLNHLLAVLPAEIFERISPHLELDRKSVV